MSVGSISFWQQNQNYWAEAQQDSAKQAASATVISSMFGASSTLSNGLSSIANQTALSRVNNALTAAVQSALQQEQTGNTTSPDSTSASSGSSPSSSSAPAVTPPAPGTGTGTVPLTGGTLLYGLGFNTKGSFTVSDGLNTTTFNVTQGDTIGDLINAINSNAAGNANAFAYLNTSGNLIVTGTNTADTITVGGSYASALGFGGSNDTFAPTAGSAGVNDPNASSSSSASSSAASSSSSTGSSATASSSTSGTASNPSGIPKNSALALQTGGTAEILLAGNGSAGNILNMLA
jgi:hypothetical protein